MNFDTQFFRDVGWQGGGTLVIILLGIIVFSVLKRCLKGLLLKEYITQALYVVVKNIVRWLLVVAVAVLVLQHVGIRVANIVTALLTIAGMIAIGFIAVWSILSNILCSLMLIMFRNFDIGDEIEIVEPVGGTGLAGRVTSFNVMFTTLTEEATDGKGDYLTEVPNNIFFQKSLRRRPGKKTEGLWQHLLTKPLPFKKRAQKPGQIA